MRDPEFHDDRDWSDGAEAKPPAPDIWQRLSRVMVIVLFLCCLVAVGRLFWPELQRQKSLDAELARLQTIHETRLRRVAELRREQDLLESDRSYLEEVARDRLDLAREGETIVRIKR